MLPLVEQVIHPTHRRLKEIMVAPLRQLRLLILVLLPVVEVVGRPLLGLLRPLLLAGMEVLALLLPFLVPQSFTRVGVAAGQELPLYQG